MQPKLFTETPRPILINEAGEHYRLNLGGKGYKQSYIEFSVRENADGTWSRRTGSNWAWSGHGGPFYGLLATKQAAIDDCVHGLTKHCQHTFQNDGLPIAKRALEWLAGFGA